MEAAQSEINPTPGPWHVRKDCGPSLYIAERGMMPHANVFGRVEENPQTVAATADLIASAPDLLEQNKRLRSALELVAGSPASQAYRDAYIVSETVMRNVAAALTPTTKL